MTALDANHRRDDTRPSTAKLTYEDFLLFPDDGQRHELIDGEHYVTPSPFVRHQTLSVRLTVVLANYLQRHPLGQLFHAPLDCVFTPFDVVEPDVLVVTNDQLEILTDKHIHGVPALVVEILSARTRRVDERTKRDLYDRAGVRQYWLVDPEADTITIYQRAAEGGFPPAERLAASRDDVLRSRASRVHAGSIRLLRPITAGMRDLCCSLLLVSFTDTKGVLLLY